MTSEPTPETTTAPIVANRGEGGRAKLKGKALTDRIIKAMRPGDELADPEHPGLRVRCPRNGLPVFFYRYRIGGSLRQIEVGVLSGMTLVEIRSKWANLRAEVRNGKDPQGAKIQAKQQKEAALKAEKQKALTVGDVVEQYLSELVEPKRKPKGAAETRRLLTQLINFDSWLHAQREKDKAAGRRRPKLPKGVGDVAGIPATSFTRAMAHNLLLAFGESAPRSGGMARQELRSCWRFAIDAGRLPGPSPFEKSGSGDDNFGGGMLKSNSKRERALTKEDAGALLRWIAEPGTYSRTVGDALELVLRTGLRSGEVCGIHSRELVRRDGVLWLELPAERMKGKKGQQRPHSVPLVGRAAEIVLARMPEHGGFLFPAKSGLKAIEQKVLGVEVYACSGRSEAAAYRHRRVCPVSDWAPHDLRRTARTLLASLNCPYEVAEAILAHTLPGVAAVYNREEYRAQKIEWLTKLGEELDRLTANQAALAVVDAA